MDSKAQTIIKKTNSLFNSIERKNSETIWKDIFTYILPTQNMNLTNPEYTTKGESKTINLMNAEAVISCRDLAAVLKDFSNPTEKPVIKDTRDELNDIHEVSLWYEKASKICHDYIAQSNLDSEAAKCFQMLCATGNAILMLEEDDFDEGGKFSGIFFTALHPANCVWTQNSKGLVDTIYIKKSLRASVAYELYGDAVSDDIKKAVEKGECDEYYDFILAIYPKKYVGKTPIGNKEKPFESCVVEVKAGKVVKVGGYWEFPVFVVRWETLPGEDIGRGPGHLAIPEVKSANYLRQLMMEGLEKNVNPPLKTNATVDIDITAGTINQLDGNEVVEPIIPACDLNSAQFGLENIERTIKRVFFLDKVLLPDRTQTGEMSAYEVARRLEETDRILGPVTGRLDREWLAPLNVRLFSILFRANKFPQLPEQLKVAGIDIKVEFVSQITRSQKIKEATSILSYAQQLGGLAQLKPEVLNIFDPYQAALIVGRSQGVPEAVIKGQEEYYQALQQQQQQAAAQQALESGVKVADMQAKQARGQMQ
jgi:hypothetical protein